MGNKKFVIWQNYDLRSEDWEDLFTEEYPDVEDEYEKYRIIADVNDEYLLDKRVNLSVDLPTDIIIIGDLEFWDGGVTGYKETNSHNLADCLHIEQDCVYAEFYVDNRKNLRSRQSHHDGTNHYLYRRWKDNVSEEQKENFLCKIYDRKADAKDIARYTRRLGDEVLNLYGIA